MSVARMGVPLFGVGVGLRVPHYRHILEHRPSMDWFEVISENFLVGGGRPLYHLDAVRETYRLIPHGVSLSIGLDEPLDWDYLRQVKALVRRIDAPWVSDHLCWTGVPGANLHDLLPLPYNRETLKVVAEKARQVQDFMEVPFALENVSSYLTYKDSVMSEWEFLCEVVERADCGLLLDVNNIYVSSYNHGFDPEVYVDAIPTHRVLQMHLAGHTDKGLYLLDTHSDHVCDPVWALYERASRRIGPCNVLIEWDDHIPPFETLAAEAARARQIQEAIHGTTTQVPEPSTTSAMDVHTPSFP